jgi:ABC-type multidrug transport system permease subunit
LINKLLTLHKGSKKHSNTTHMPHKNDKKRRGAQVAWFILWATLFVLMIALPSELKDSSFLQYAAILIIPIAIPMLLTQSFPSKEMNIILIFYFLGCIGCLLYGFKIN